MIVFNQIVYSLLVLLLKERNCAEAGLYVSGESFQFLCRKIEVLAEHSKRGKERERVFKNEQTVFVDWYTPGFQ